MALSRITEAVASFTDLTIGDDLTLTDDFLMASDASIIKFGADADVTLTHVHNTGLLLNSTSVIQFNDSSQNIGAPNATTLDINATDEIELNATLIDVNGNLDVSGTITGASTIQGTTITATTAFVPDANDGATLGSTTREFADLFLADGGQILFGNDQEITLSHNADNGLILKHVGTGDGIEPSLTFQAGDTDIAANDVLGSIFFQAPDEGAGTDAILIAAGIEAVSEGDFSASNNATKLSFLTAASELASEKMSLSSAGLLTVADDIVFKDGGTIGVTSAVDAMTVSSGGIVTFKDDILIKDGGTIGSASDADAITIAANGQLTLTQTLIGTALDISGDIDVDGTTNLDVVDIDGAVDMASTLQVDGAITSSAGATITTADNLVQLTLKSTDADANTGPILDMIRDSSSPADGDEIGRIRFIGDDDGGNATTFAYLQVKINDATDASDDGELELLTRVDGTSRSRMELLPTETVFNEDSQSIDFRVESDGLSHALFVDASADAVGVGTASPTNIQASGDPCIEIKGANGPALVINDTGQSEKYALAAASDDLRVRYGTTNLFFIKDSGNIGIGIASPTIDGALAGVSVPSGSKLLHIDDGDGAYLKLSDPASGSNRGGQVALFNTTMVVNNCESGDMVFGTSNAKTMNISAAGEVTKPLQPAFLAKPASNQDDIATGSNVTVVLGNEVYDIGSNFSSNIFTAPVTGKYLFIFSVYGSQLDGDSTYLEIAIVTSNRGYATIQEPSGSEDVYAGGTVSIVADMDANDTAYARVAIGAGAATFDVTTSSNFSGALIC